MNLASRARLWHRAWRYRLRTERQEIAFVRSLIAPGDLVLDIGAHKAAFSYWMAKRAGRAGRVIAFEPNPLLATYLRDVASCFPVGSIRVVDVALSDRCGTAELHFPGSHLGSASIELKRDVLQGPIEVPIATLDEYLASTGPHPPVRFIKCDVESHELAVFRGAIKTLRRDRPVLLFESGDFEQRPERLAPVNEFLRAIGYAGHFFSNSRLYPISDYVGGEYNLSREKHQNYVYFDPTVYRLTRRRVPYNLRREESRSVSRAA